jgi:two-component system sensor histidine kinase DesK
MRERLAALGGRLEAGPGPRGGFEVRGILPIGQADPLTVPVPLVDGGR